MPTVRTSLVLYGCYMLCLQQLLHSKTFPVVLSCFLCRAVKIQTAIVVKYYTGLSSSVNSSMYYYEIVSCKWL